MKAVIIDDERKARNYLKTLLENHCPTITQITTAEDLLSGIDTIREMNPDIVFLDIEMPQHSGLEIMDYFEDEKINFEIIFTTAYSEYAIQAFELSAIDYLLKPLSAEKLINAVEKAEEKRGNSQIDLRLTELKKSLQKSDFKKIGLPHSDGIKFVEIEDLIVLKADGMYTDISTTKYKKIVVCKPLKHFVELLKEVPAFYRPHRSYLINLKYITEYIKKDGGYIKLENGQSVSISNEKKEEFLNIIQNI